MLTWNKTRPEALNEASDQASKHKIQKGFMTFQGVREENKIINILRENMTDEKGREWRWDMEIVAFHEEKARINGTEAK